jgi:hypothetical protein
VHKIFEGLPGNFLKKFPRVSTPNASAKSEKAQFLRGHTGNIFLKVPLKISSADTVARMHPSFTAFS